MAMGLESLSRKYHVMSTMSSAISTFVTVHGTWVDIIFMLLSVYQRLLCVLYPRRAGDSGTILVV